MSLRDLLRKDGDGVVADETGDPTEDDRLVLEQLRAAGADLSQSREVNHFIHLPSREAAEALSPIVKNEGHDVKLVEPDPEIHDELLPWTVVATSHTVVSDEGVAAARRRFTELAAEYGGKYDGWEAAV
jgi:hypothetical protein